MNQTAAEIELSLVNRYKAGDESAFAELLKRHEGWIWKWVRRNTRNGYDRIDEDLFQAGAMGLHRAIKTWDHTRARLLTYATQWIRQRMHRHIQKHGRLIYLPDGHARSEGPRVTSLYAARDAGGEQRLIDVIPVNESPSDDINECERREQDTQKAAALLRLLTPREAEVLKRRAAGEILEQIGNSLRVTKERVRQIETAALDKLKRRAANITEEQLLAVKKPAPEKVATQPPVAILPDIPLRQAKEMALRMIREGKGSTEIILNTGLSKSCVCGMAKRLGIAMPKPGWHSRPRRTRSLLCQQCGKRFPRRDAEVKSQEKKRRKKEMGIYCSRECFRASQAWTAAHDEHLRINLRSKTHKQMAIELGKTKSAVDNRCSQLGLLKFHQYSMSDLSFIANNRYWKTTTEIAESLGVSREALWCAMRTYGLSRKRSKIAPLGPVPLD